MKDWNEKDIEIAKSRGGVIAIKNPWNNLVTTGITPWPVPEIIQKVYESNQIGAFQEEQQKIAVSYLGYYTDIQSIHSEDSITWSVIGTVKYASSKSRNIWVQDFFSLLKIPLPTNGISNIFLWRRIPHPDTLVSGGPEIDFGIITDNTLVFGEAKWRSSIGIKQGKYKDKDQIQLRMEYLEKYGNILYPKILNFVVVAVSINGDVPAPQSSKKVIYQSLSWEQVCSIQSHPLYDEINRYYQWKKLNSKPISGKK